MPVYNERTTVEEIVRRVRGVPLESLAEAGSIDRLILHDVNRGKGAALSTGFGAASGDAVLVQDADLEYDPQEYLLLLSPIWENKADVVYGSRFLGGRPHRVLYFWHYVGNRLLTLISNMVTNLNLSDMETCYKCFRREVLQSLEIDTYAEGKKIGWRDGMRAIYCIWRYGFWRKITGRAKRRSGPRESSA
jgi:glycosyltransferase involved in cell wall biosynthesis